MRRGIVHCIVVYKRKIIKKGGRYYRNIALSLGKGKGLDFTIP